MIAVDTNILVYAHREDNPFHDKALKCLTTLAEGSRRWAIPWPCVHEYIAIVTHPRIYSPPTPIDLALESIAVWIDSPMCATLHEGVGYFNLLAQCANGGHVHGAMIHDARIAAICMHNGVRQLLSADRDFSRFPGVNVTNPMTD